MRSTWWLFWEGASRFTSSCTHGLGVGAVRSRLGLPAVKIFSGQCQTGPGCIGVYAPAFTSTPSCTHGGGWVPFVAI